MLSRLVLLAVAFLCFHAEGALAQARQRVAILPMVVNAMDDRDYLRDGVSDMLTSRLGQQPGVAVIRVQDPEQATTEAADAAAAGRTVGADWVLFGSFTRFGEGASLDLRCVSVKEGAEIGPRSIFIQSGSLGEIIPRLDSIADRVARHVVSGGREGQDVATAPPAAAGGRDLASEVQALRGRVRSLEERVESGTVAAPEEDLSASSFDAAN